jgi:hypothetical protein
MSAQREQEPLPAIRITHYATSAEVAYEEHVDLCDECGAELDSGSECIDGSWLCVSCWPEAAREAAEVVAIAAYEASVQHRLSDLANEGSWWTYGHVDPPHQDDEVQGYGCWLECTVGRESDTGVWLSEPEWASFESAADEGAARTEATRRNWGTA